MLFGERIDARYACEIGLISRVVPGSVREEARARADLLASQTHREAVMLLKATLVSGAGAEPGLGAKMAYISDVALSRSPHFLEPSQPEKAK